MSRKKLALIIALIVSAGAIASGIVYAQEASSPQAETLRALLNAEAESSQEPGARSFSFFLDGGAFLGVGTEDITKENMARYGVREVRGVGVTEVAKDSPAEKAGVRKDDVILRFDGESVTSVRKLTRLINESSPDQNVRITISRGLSKKETGDVSLTIVRDRNTRTVTLTPEKNPDANLIRPGTMGTRRVMIPSIAIPAIPEMNIRVPRIAVPATPPIEVTVPQRAPRVRTIII